MASPTIIIGDKLVNLQPDGPQWREKDVVFVSTLAGVVQGKAISERMQVIKPSSLVSLPPFFTPNSNPQDNDTFFQGFKEEYDKSGQLSKLTLHYKSLTYESSAIGIAQNETLVEMDQSFQQIPIERDPYFVTTKALTPDDYAMVAECLSSGHWQGTFKGEGEFDLGFDSGSGQMIYEIPGQLDPDPYKLSVGATELFLEKLKGRDYILRPSVVFRVTTAGPVVQTSFNTAMTNSGQLQHPGYGLPGTADNWLLNTPRLERRRSNGALFHQQVKEWIYNAAAWDTTPYRFYALAM